MKDAAELERRVGRLEAQTLFLGPDQERFRRRVNDLEDVVMDLRRRDRKVRQVLSAIWLALVWFFALWGVASLLMRALR